MTAALAFARATALADEARSIPAWSTPPNDVHERDWRAGYAAAMADFADRLGHILASAGERIPEYTADDSDLLVDDDEPDLATDLANRGLRACCGLPSAEHCR